jgi:hypothetical protein
VGSDYIASAIPDGLGSKTATAPASFAQVPSATTPALALLALLHAHVLRDAPLPDSMRVNVHVVGMQARLSVGLLLVVCTRVVAHGLVGVSKSHRILLPVSC